MSRPRRFAVPLALVALLALAIRIAYGLAQQGYPVIGDARTFHLVAQGIADGRGFVEAFAPYGPTAEHPPLFFLFLAGLDALGVNSTENHRLALGVVGTANVVLIGLLARSLAGPGVGLLAAALAAVYPLLWTADGSLMSETLYGTLLLCSLLAAVWLARSPSPRRAALLGALLGLAALTRGEALALVGLLGVPLTLALVRGWRARAGLLAALAGALLAVLAPWTIRNAVAFGTLVPISTNSSGIFVGANCRDTYYGPLIGAWRFQCYTPRRPGEDEAAYFARQRSIGLRYARDHAGRLPLVVAARLGRVLDVFRFGQSLFFNAAEGRRVDWVSRGIRLYWVVALLALGGIAVLARRRARVALVVLLAPVAMVLAVAAATYGGTRFRYAAEPSLIVLAAIALGAAAAALRARAAARRAAPPPA